MPLINEHATDNEAIQADAYDSARVAATTLIRTAIKQRGVCRTCKASHVGNHILKYSPSQNGPVETAWPMHVLDGCYSHLCAYTSHSPLVDVGKEDVYADSHTLPSRPRCFLKRQWLLEVHPAPQTASRICCYLRLQLLAEPHHRDFHLPRNRQFWLALVLELSALANVCEALVEMKKGSLELQADSRLHMPVLGVLEVVSFCRRTPVVPMLWAQAVWPELLPPKSSGRSCCGLQPHLFPMGLVHPSQSLAPARPPSMPTASWGYSELYSHVCP